MRVPFVTHSLFVMPKGFKNHRNQSSLDKFKSHSVKPESKQRTQADKIRSSVRWQKTRARITQQQPLCICILPDACGHVGTQVHHIQPVILRPGLAYEPSNLVNLCDACHDHISGLERAGKDAVTPVIEAMKKYNNINEL